MKKFGLIFAGVLLLIGAVIVFVPATLINGRLAAATGGRLNLAEANGTVWRGEGALTDAKNTWQLPLAWKLDAASLASGDLALTLSPVRNATQPSGTINLSATSIALANFRGTIPAQALAAMLPLRDAPALGGDISVDAPAFRWNGASGEGALKLSWMRARLATTAGSADLGTVEIAVTPQDTRLLGRVSNAGGEVAINGTIGLTSSSNEGDLTIAPLPGAPLALLRALATFGTADPSGAVRVSWRNSGR